MTDADGLTEWKRRYLSVSSAREDDLWVSDMSSKWRSQFHYKDVALPAQKNPTVEIRRSYDRLISTLGFHPYISVTVLIYSSQIATFMGPTWGPPGSCPRWAPCWPYETCSGLFKFLLLYFFPMTLLSPLWLYLHSYNCISAPLAFTQYTLIDNWLLLLTYD